MKEDAKKKKDEQDLKNLSKQLATLLIEVKKINKDIDDTNKGIRKEIGEIKAGVDESIKDIKKIFYELDTVEKGAGDELDKLMTNDAQYLASTDTE